jgi:hypothetical protein
VLLENVFFFEDYLEGCMRRYIVWILVIPSLLWSVPAPIRRGSSYPFVSGDSFRAYSDYVYDELDRSLDPTKMEPYSTLFLKTDYLEEFCNQIHPQIPGPYILITHNSDYGAPRGYTDILDDDKLIAWFAMNYDGYPHPKLHSIPIGIANRCWRHGNIEVVKMVVQEDIEKIWLAYMNFDSANYPTERIDVYNQFLMVPFCHATGRVTFDAFLRELSRSYFVIAPRGNGLDTHRIWESLYCRSIPIVKTSSLDSLYEGLPIIIVDDWDSVDQEFLERKKEEFTSKSLSWDKAYMDYWVQLIDSFKSP